MLEELQRLRYDLGPGAEVRIDVRLFGEVHIMATWMPGGESAEIVLKHGGKMPADLAGELKRRAGR